MEALDKLCPGDEVIIFLNSDKGRVGVALCAWQDESSQGFLLWLRTLASLSSL